MSDRKEYCCHCGDTTGRAGIHEDSLYSNDHGPFCESCYEPIARLEAQLAEARDLARFLAGAWDAFDDWAHRHFTKDNFGDYPQVQGMRNQIALRRIGRQEYDSAAVKRAVNALAGEGGEG